MSIVSISGKKQSGKNTIAKIINQLTNNKYEEKCFADKLKDIICILINCTREQLEDESFKSKELGEESGIPSVAVKCVDIRRNTSGEGDFLDCN